MLIRKFLQPYKGLHQGNWIETSQHKGIYITSISSSKSIIATYVNKQKKYVTIDSSDMIKISINKDRKLFDFARKHVLWRDYYAKSKFKSKTKQSGSTSIKKE